MPTLVIGVLELQLDKQGIYCRAAVLDHIIESVSDIVAAYVCLQLWRAYLDPEHCVVR